VEDQIGKIDEKAKRIYLLRAQRPDAKDVEPNLEMCDAYGGCPHRGVGCHLTALDHFKATEARINMLSAMDIIARAKQEKEAAAGLPPLPQENPGVPAAPSSVPVAPVAAAVPGVPAVPVAPAYLLCRLLELSRRPPQ
jgi:hypothetical protein